MESSHSLVAIMADLVIWHRQVFLAGLFLITVLFLVLFIQEMRRGRGPTIESNWGGIGGGGSGWRMSGSLTYLLAMLGTATLLTILLIHFDNPTKQEKPSDNAPAVENKATASRATPVANAAVTPAPTVVATPRSITTTPTP
jgi:hypothetical protein